MGLQEKIFVFLVISIPTLRKNCHKISKKSNKNIENWMNVIFYNKCVRFAGAEIDKSSF